MSQDPATARDYMRMKGPVCHLCGHPVPARRWWWQRTYWCCPDSVGCQDRFVALMILGLVAPPTNPDGAWPT